MTDHRNHIEMDAEADGFCAYCLKETIEYLKAELAVKDTALERAKNLAKMAVQAVEEGGAHPRLTDAVTILGVLVGYYPESMLVNIKRNDRE